MKRLYFIRKTQDDLLKEQNKLLSILIAQQQQAVAQQPAQVVIREIVGPETTKPKEEVASAADDFAIDDIPYIPKIVKGEANLASVDTSKSKFDPKEVEKLKQARAKALKEHPQD